MSENNAHTPGPWHVSDVSDLYIVQRDGMQEYAICKMLTAWDASECNANAALIARAPEHEAENKRMREALTEINGLRGHSNSYLIIRRVYEIVETALNEQQ